MEWAAYNVVVSNIGMVGDYDTLQVAESKFYAYVTLSKIGSGRKAGQSVYLFDGDKIIEEYHNKKASK